MHVIFATLPKVAIWRSPFHPAMAKHIFISPCALHRGNFEGCRVVDVDNFSLDFLVIIKLFACDVLQSKAKCGPNGVVDYASTRKFRKSRLAKHLGHKEGCECPPERSLAPRKICTGNFFWASRPNQPPGTPSGIHGPAPPCSRCPFVLLQLVCPQPATARPLQLPARCNLPRLPCCVFPPACGACPASYNDAYTSM